MREPLSLGIIFLLLILTSLAPYIQEGQVGDKQLTLKNEHANVQGFQVPLVFSKGCFGDFSHGIGVYKIEDSKYFIGKGSLTNPEVGNKVNSGSDQEERTTLKYFTKKALIWHPYGDHMDVVRKYEEILESFALQVNVDTSTTLPSLKVLKEYAIIVALYDAYVHEFIFEDEVESLKQYVEAGGRLLGIGSGGMVIVSKVLDVKASAELYAGTFTVRVLNDTITGFALESTVVAGYAYLYYIGFFMETPEIPLLELVEKGWLVGGGGYRGKGIAMEVPTITMGTEEDVTDEWKKLQRNVISWLIGFKEKPRQGFRILWEVPIIDNTQAYVDVGDIDGDGIDDVAVMPYRKGEHEAHWYTLQAIRSTGELLWSRQVYIHAGGVAIADVDADGKGEVIVHGFLTDGGYGAHIYVFDDNGSLLWEFHQRKDVGYWDLFQGLVLANLDGDPQLEILPFSRGWERYTIYALDDDGSVLWVFTAPDWIDTVDVGDVTGDGREEIVIATYGDVFILNSRGDVINTISNPLSGLRDKALSLGDVNGDGVADIIFAMHASDVNDINRLYIFRNDGYLLFTEEYSSGTANGFRLFPVLYDVNGDGINDIVVHVEEKIYAYKYDGSLLWEFGNTTFFGKHSRLYGAFDIDGDGRKEVVFGVNREGIVYIYGLDANGKISFYAPLPHPGYIAHRLQWMNYPPRTHRLTDINMNSLIELPIIRIVDNKYYIAILEPLKVIGKVSLHVSKPDVVPMNRFFKLDVSISSDVDYAIKLTVVLDEHTGFQAGEEYGDGDEVYNISLAPHENKTISFKAKVYGVPRGKEVAIFKVYDENGELLTRRNVHLNLILEFASIWAVIRPPWVEVGKSFKVVVPVSYSFTRPTLAKVVLECNGDTVDFRETMLSGDGLELFTFNVGRDLTAEPSTLSFTVKLSTFYPEEGMKVAPIYEGFEARIRKFQVLVSVKTANQPKSQLYPTGIFYTIIFDGKTYYAMLMYNASAEPPQMGSSIEDYLHQRYLYLNWLVFEVGDEGLELVMDDKLYQDLALIAEIAYSRWGIWNPHNIDAISSMYKELYSHAIEAEAVLIFQKAAIRLIMLFKGRALESSIIEKIGSVAKVAGVYLKAEEILEYAKKIKFAETLLKALKETGGAVEYAVVWASIINLERASTALEEANKLLRDVKPGKYIDGKEALEFLEKFAYGRGLGTAAVRILGARYSKWWLSFIEGIKEIVPLSSAIEIYEKLKDLLGTKSFKEYLSLIVNEMKYYNIWADTLKRKSLGFRDAFNQTDLSNNIVVKLKERRGEHKLYLHIYDVEGRHIGFNEQTGLVEVEIPSSQYFDFGSEILIILPADVNISRVVVDASKAKKTKESYTLEVMLLRNGEAIGEKSVDAWIQRDTYVGYRVTVGEAEVSIKREYVEAAKLTPAIPIEYIAIITILVIALIITVSIKRKRR